MNDDSLRLFGYWRSSSSYRVRIAINLKGLAFENLPVHLVRDGGEQQTDAYRAVNPLGLVPALQHGSLTVVQSVAICEYLEERFPQPGLLPADAPGRARVRALVQTIASEMQPVNNLGVLRYLSDTLQQGQPAVDDWYRHWIARGFSAIETWLGEAATGAYCHGDLPTLADCFLVPQVYNAERFGCDLGPYPRLLAVTGRCRVLEAFRQAAPEVQPDAV